AVSGRPERTRPPSLSRENRALMELHGAIGEAYFFEQMRRVLPNFDESCWVSEIRARYGLEGGGRDDLGYDFEYRDSDGTLTARGDSPLCLVEVKATTREGSSPFPISSTEWNVAQECHSGQRESIYVIVRIESVNQNPRISDVLFDPIALIETGALAADSQDLWI